MSNNSSKESFSFLALVHLLNFILPANVMAYSVIWMTKFSSLTTAPWSRENVFACINSRRNQVIRILWQTMSDLWSEAVTMQPHLCKNIILLYIYSIYNLLYLYYKTKLNFRLMQSLFVRHLFSFNHFNKKNCCDSLSFLKQKPVEHLTSPRASVSDTV